MQCAAYEDEGGIEVPVMLPCIVALKSAGFFAVNDEGVLNGSKNSSRGAVAT